MKLIIALSTFFIAFVSFAQVNFEPGFIIDKSGTKTECLIENKDWFYNPTAVRYKINSESDIKTATPQTIKSFEIRDKVRYIGIEANLDQSSTKELDLDSSPDPNYEKRFVFMKELVSGDAKLFVFRENSLELFFYSLNESEPVPLIHKRYYSRSGRHNTIKRIISNDTYKNELFNNLKCEAINLADVRDLTYNTKSLASFFSDYNFCKTGIVSDSKTSKNKGKYNLRAKVGISFGQFL